MISIKKFIPGIAWFFLVLILICLPGNDLPKANSWMTAIYFDKWVHVSLFSCLAFLFMRPIGLLHIDTKSKLQWLLKVAIATSIWGLTTEYIQMFFIPGRSFDLGDWAADTFGALLAVATTYWLYIKKAAK